MNRFRSDPLYLYKNNWLSQQLPSSTDWELLRSQHDDPNNQNRCVLICYWWWSRKHDQHFLLLFLFYKYPAFRFGCNGFGSLAPKYMQRWHFQATWSKYWLYARHISVPYKIFLLHDPEKRNLTAKFCRLNCLQRRFTNVYAFNQQELIIK